MKAGTAALVSVLLTGMVGCGATTEVLLAPFELTSDVTSSTSGAAFIGPAKAHQRLEHFVASSYEQVSGDIARGNGEYLASLAVLAGVPTDAQPAFQAEMQSRYATLYDPSLPRMETWGRVVNTAWSAGHGRLQGIGAQ